MLQSNLEELERLRSIINDMLFLASADQGSKATKLITSSLADEVATTLDYLDFILEDAQVQVRVTGDAQVQIEKAHLRRALINLLCEDQDVGGIPAQFPAGNHGRASGGTGGL